MFFSGFFQGVQAPGCTGFGLQEWFTGMVCGFQFTGLGLRVWNDDGGPRGPHTKTHKPKSPIGPQRNKG